MSTPQTVKRKATAAPAAAPVATQRRTDGQDGPPQIVSAPGSQNSALKEAPPQPSEWVNPTHPHRAQGLVIADRAAGIVTGATRKKIAICGFASSSRHLVPVHDPAWEIWGLNQLYRHIARADRWFDIHYYWEQEVVPGTEGSGPGSYIHWLRDCGMPVYMHHLVDDLPTSVRFPLERLIERHGADYFTSTIAFMVALAIDEIDGRVDADMRAWLQSASKAEILERDPSIVRKELYGAYTLGVYGVDLIVGDEYFWQKACAEYWLGAASARGIQVQLPAQTALCKQQYRYGYEKEPDTIIKMSEVKEHVAALTKQRDECLKQLYCLDGALQADDYWNQVLTVRLRGLGSP